ncbi:CsgG/HfaB family protein [Zoogloea sp.]|uniref:CsgG/HfaB family protein n=1 Tax=Zoogloea sp. TaxID=49181 RepID=UPI002637029E|nr:CsgG/HfaB family protein [Zoogloea sp.]MDD3352866.1 CsgG/HfaB family protein [Zoogloea sp.]
MTTCHGLSKPAGKLALLAALVALSGCANMQMGSEEAKTAATGSAGGANTQNANSKLEKCEAPLGTMAVVEDTSAPWYGILTGQMKLGSTVPVLKLLIQQSNCFVVVERGRAMNNLMQERALQQSGELRNKSNFGKGQMAAADYSISPSITFSNNNAGGMTGGLGGIGGGVLGAVIGSVNVKEASTMLTLIDNRSSVQLAAAEGSARNMDFGGMGALLGGGMAGGLGGYTNTAEGKVIVAAFTDAYNNVVKAVKNYKAQEVKGGLGTGGQLGVQGSESSASARSAAPRKKRK